MPELNAVMAFAKEHWEQISVFANSIGAWFSLLSFSGETLDHCLFVSPVLDMKQLTLKMMNWANVSEEQLKKERVIPTSFGQTLSLDYWNYVLSHPITKWISPTNILYGAKDHLMDYETVESFARQFHCRLTVMENGGHWFHTEPQMDFLRRWLTGNFKDEDIPDMRPKA